MFTQADWDKSADLADQLAWLCKDRVQPLKTALGSLVTAGEVSCLYDPCGSRIALVGDQSATQADLERTKIAVDRLFELPIVAVNRAEWAKNDQAGCWVKMGNTLGVGKVAGEEPYYPFLDFSSPSSVGSMLASGLIGSGLGYGAGWLGEHVLPKDWRRNRLRWTLAALGGLAGMAPGLLERSNTARENQYGGPSSHNAGLLSPEFHKSAQLFGDDGLIGGSGNDTGVLGLPPVNVDALGRVIWGDPHVSNQLSPDIQGTTTAVLGAAQRMPGGIGPGWVTPFQMGRLAAGMGAGYMSGALVGGALGLLTGAPPHVQDMLKRTGLYAGAITAVVPRLFGP